jgi:hypothetical protein
MAILPITSLLTGSSTPLLASGDVLVFVDISDLTQAPTGSTVKATQTQFFAAINVPIVITSASAGAFAVGLTGSTNSAFKVDASTASQVAGLKITGAATGGTVALVVTDSGAAANLTINALGIGTIGIGSVSTGRVTITPALTIIGLLTAGAGLTITSGQALNMAGAVMSGGATWNTAQPITLSTAAQPNITSLGTIAALVAGTGTFSSTLGVTGTATLGVVNASGAVATGALTVTGAATVSTTLGVTGAISGTTAAFSTSSAGQVVWSFANTNAGAAANGLLAVRNDAAYQLGIGVYSAAFTTSGYNVANGGRMFCDGPGGVSLVAADTAGVFRFYVGGATSPALTVVAAGQLQFANISATPAGLVDGQLFYDGTNLRVRLGGATKTVTVS